MYSTCTDVYFHQYHLWLDVSNVTSHIEFPSNTNIKTYLKSLIKYKTRHKEHDNL